MFPPILRFFKHLRARIGLWAAARALDRSSGPVHINEVLRQPRVLLVFLPRQADELPPAVRQMRRLASALGIQELLLVKHAAVDLGPGVGGSVVEWSEQDLGVFLPKRSATDQILAALTQVGPIDLAVDLNRPFCLPTTYWSLRSGARIRIGFESAWSRRFLNLEYRPRDSAAGAQGAFRGLADFLLTAAGRPGPPQQEPCT